MAKLVLKKLELTRSSDS